MLTIRITERSHNVFPSHACMNFIFYFIFGWKSMVRAPTQKKEADRNTNN